MRILQNFLAFPNNNMLSDQMINLKNPIKRVHERVSMIVIVIYHNNLYNLIHMILYNLNYHLGMLRYSL